MSPLPTGANTPANGFQRGDNTPANTSAIGVATGANGMCSNPPYTPEAVRRSAPSGLWPSGRSFRPLSRNAAELSRLEDAIQRAVFDHVRLRGAPGLMAWHTLNCGKRNRIEAAILKGLGVHHPGVCDVIAVDRRPTEAQLRSTFDTRAAGAFTCVAHDLARALAVLESWGQPRGRVS